MRLDHHLGDGGDIAEAQIEPLAGDGVHDVGRITNQGEPLVDAAVDELQVQRIGPAGPGQGQFP